MRRTYRSKKDTGGALDHRDVLLNMDERSSAFDAFYIQNIKQTKRELSCVTSSNHIGVASNRVRKRKYVKRIVKEVEPLRQRDTISSSAYLTPDKSIRVNKVLDPFDMLLNSSLTNQDVPTITKHKEFEEIMPKKKSKTYTRKKQPKVKKFYYSSADSNCTDSEKENTTDSQANMTDIRKHELVIEKEPKSSPKYFDESINKIVNNIYLNNFKRKVSNGSFNTSYKCSRNKKQLFHSPILPKSPLCSTPFQEKYRGMSIFKFSPISQTEQEMSPSHNVSILEEKDKSNHSIILVGKAVGLKVSKKNQSSPLTHLSDLSIVCNSNLNDKKSNSNASKQDIVQNETEYVENEVQTNISSNEQSSLQITSADPFLGFSNKNDEDITTVKNCLLECLKEYNLTQENVDFHEKDLKNNKTNENNFEKTYHTNRSSVNSQNSDRDSLYDTCNSEQSSIVDNSQHNREPVVAIERISDSVLKKYYEKFTLKSHNEEMTNNDDYEALQANLRDDGMSAQTDNDDFDSLRNDSNEDGLNDSMSTESDHVDTKQIPIVITDSSTTEDIISNDEESDGDEEGINNEDEGCISFVTTRRRNEITNDSMFIFENSYGSSSTDCDKTVLSNIRKKSDVINIEVPSEYSIIDVDTNKEDKVCEDFKLIGSPSNEITSRMSVRKNSNMPRENNSLSPNVIYDKKLPIKISRISTRKTLKLQRETVIDSNNSSYDEKLTNSQLHTISKISARKSSKLPRQSHFSSPELNASENEITLIEANEPNITMVENDSIEIGTVDLENRDAISPLSMISKEGNIKDHNERSSYAGAEVKPCIVLQPGKKWERSLSIYRRMTMAADHFDKSILEDECLQNKGRKYRQSVINTMEMQDRDSLHNDSINSRRSTFLSKSSRPTIRFVKDPNISISRVSLNTTSIFDDLKGFLNEECDDTVVELSKLSIADSEHEITILNNFHETERVATAKDYVLRRCNQTEPILFDECYPETVLKNCHKIGEGVYGEVFLWRGRDGRARVMKIVPIAGTIKVNGEDQKDFHEIISEIVIAMELSALRAPIANIERQLDEGKDIHELKLHTIENATDTFNEVLAVRCVHGPYPSRLLDLWDLYDECKGSDNDSPAALPADQRYIVLELANAGSDLESYQFASAQQAHALFQQIAFGLAVAEEAFQFEHRDLHWGNVLIAPTEQKLATFILRGRVHRVPRCGVAATIIDYSLSRLSLPLGAESAALYNDLATDEQLFDAVGDYQFEVYRLMRDKLGNDWKNFEPYTNILWLHYTVDKMITALRYKRTNTKIHKHYIEKLKGIKNRILEYGSAVQYVLTDTEF